ncbi:MAG: LLM class F420-dependent oxidoreductase [Ilumatobacteraceae bacterium]
MGTLEIGLVQAFDGSSKYGPAYARDFAQAVEALGFHSLWVPEHIVFFEQYESEYPYPPEPGSTERPKLPVGTRPALFDPMLTCQALAMHTTTLRVGTAVALLPLRHPLLWAREISTLDHFAGGRFEFGIGIGWLEEEFDALGVPFHQRGRIADEYLGALHAAWTQESSTFHGEHVDFTDALTFPKPVQTPGPPVYIGGESPAALRRVARFGDGWYGWNMTPAEFAEGLVRLDDELTRSPFVDGRMRSRDDVCLQVGLRHLGPIDDLVALVDGYRAAGAQRIVASLAISSRGFEQRLAEVAEALGIAAGSPTPPARP